MAARFAIGSLRESPAELAWRIAKRLRTAPQAVSLSDGARLFAADATEGLGSFETADRCIGVYDASVKLQQLEDDLRAVALQQFPEQAKFDLRLRAAG
jgi:hypothetical protein